MARFTKVHDPYQSRTKTQSDAFALLDLLTLLSTLDVIVDIPVTIILFIEATLQISTNSTLRTSNSGRRWQYRLNMR